MAKNGKKTAFPSKQKAIEFVSKQPYPIPINIDFDVMKNNQAPIAFIDEDLPNIDSSSHGL